MWAKVNTAPIIKDHFQTLKRGKENKLSSSDCFLFFGIPFGAALVVVYCWGTPGKGLVEVLTTALSIFAALLFNLLLLIYDLVKKHETKESQATNIEDKEFTQRPKLKTQILQETYTNISFCTLIAIVTIGFLLLLYPENIFKSVIASLLSFIMYYLVGVFLLSLLMILKRTHLLMKDELGTRQS